MRKNHSKIVCIKLVPLPYNFLLSKHKHSYMFQLRSSHLQTVHSYTYSTGSYTWQNSWVKQRINMGSKTSWLHRASIIFNTLISNWRTQR